jgi:hypothetical protein
MALPLLHTAAAAVQEPVLAITVLLVLGAVALVVSPKCRGDDGEGSDGEGSDEEGVYRTSSLGPHLDVSGCRRGYRISCSRSS